jgi:hypothetical protein
MAFSVAVSTVIKWVWFFFISMLMLSVAMPSVVMLSVVMPSVVAPFLKVRMKRENASDLERYKVS